jgi:metallo-beta-lactamase family protein
MAIALTVLEDSSRGTGACVLLEYEGRRLLLDCGYDDSGPLSLSPSLPVPAASLDAVVLSHGHLGHCGLLPILVRGGFAGKVYCTVATG